MKRLMHALGLVTCCLLGINRAAAETSLTAEQLGFFEKKIRPVLATHCYKCHAADAEKVRGELLVDSREGLRKGGESGTPAVVPGDPAKSLLVKALRHTDERLKMPKLKEKLPEEVIADFEQWIRMGRARSARRRREDHSRRDRSGEGSAVLGLPTARESAGAHGEGHRLAALGRRSLSPRFHGGQGDEAGG